MSVLRPGRLTTRWGCTGDGAGPTACARNALGITMIRLCTDEEQVSTYHNVGRARSDAAIRPRESGGYAVGRPARLGPPPRLTDAAGRRGS